jgi:hypothetical protein
MRRITGILAAAILGVTLSLAQAGDKPDATIKLSGGSVAAGVGLSWGSGTLHYEGKSYPIKVTGLSVGDVGVTKIEASGRVFDLKKLDDFDGNYTAVAAGATVAGGAAALAMKNQNGVTVKLLSTTQGVKFALGTAGVDMKIEK